MIEQIMIALTSVIAIYLSQSNGEYTRYACLFGMAGQPFWFYSAYQAEQWGIFIICFFYALAWAKGIKTFWLKPKGENHASR